MTDHQKEREHVFSRLNERFGGRVKAMYVLSPRNLRIKFESHNFPVFWTDGNVQRDEEQGNIHISKFEVLALVRAREGMLSPDFEVTVYTLNKDMNKVQESLEAIETMMLPSADAVLLDVQINQELDALLAAQEKRDSQAIQEIKENLMNLQKKRMMLELY
jgi:hypothetical protein